MKTDTYDTIIVGAGATGCSAAIYATRYAMKTLMLGGPMPGGLITEARDVENYPGFKKLTGLKLAGKIKEHALEYKKFVEFKQANVTGIKKHGSCFTVTAEKKNYTAKTIILATGARHKELNIPGEMGFKNQGVHSCALCDGVFYKNKIVAVVGGSDSAAKEAMLLTQWAKKVYIIYRGDQIHPEPINMDRIKGLIKKNKIEIINNTNLKAIKGNKFVTRVILDKPYKNSKEFNLDAVFIEIGAVPQSDLAKKLGVKLNEKYEIIINRESKTNIPGFFAAGDVVDTKFKQAITGVAEAVSAAYSAYQHIGSNKFFACNDEENN